MCRGGGPISTLLLYMGDISRGTAVRSSMLAWRAGEVERLSKLGGPGARVDFKVPERL